MTHEDLLEWGRTEAAIRKAEMTAVNSAESLKHVQDAVKKRRQAAKIAPIDAAYAVMKANER